MAPDNDNEQKSRGRGLSHGSIRRGSVARWGIRAVRLVQSVVWQAIGIVLALVIVFEEWGWRPLAALLVRLTRIDVVARLEAAVAALSPWPALGVFLVPSVLFLPLKLAALWLISGGHAVSATALFVFAKIAGTALYARIFQLTQPRLMQLTWFARLYNWFMPWKEAVVAHARSTAVWQAALVLKGRVKAAAKAAWQRLKPVALAAVQRVRQWLPR